MKIGIDIDDTISDTYEVQFNLAQHYTINTLKRDGKIQQLDNLTTHFYTKYLHNWNEEEKRNFFLKHYRECLEKVKPKMFAKEILDKLKKEGNEIYLVTARFDFGEVNAKSVTEKWIKENNISCDKLIVDAQDKAKIAKEYNLDIFFDDSYDNCKKVSDIGIKAYLMDSRVNRGVKEENIERIYSWPHFYQKIKEETQWKFMN